MENLYQQQTYHSVIERLNKLSPTSQRLWGKMEVAQMLAHCKEAFKVPLAKKPMKRSPMFYLFGWMVKAKLYNDEKWKQGLPTAPNFIIKDQRNFLEEKEGLLKLVNEFYTLGPQGSGLYPHPVFGKFTAEQWGKAMYKHLDHHLRQFGE
ncbi:MAG TPA: DUF1569 domain-containing protein [Ferruginibacter sp.]|nr:DUF1569 domain-containing protein [Ferruginibacter sp.]